MSAPVLAATAWKSNAELIEACARLGYLCDEDFVLDLTYGKGTFWKRWRPPYLVTNDIDRSTGAAFGYDWSKVTKFGRGQFDVVVFDPPYKLNGTSTESVDARYGVADKATIHERHELMRQGLIEAMRLSSRYVLAKCQNQVSSGRVWWQTDMLTWVARESGFTKVDELHLLRTPRKQPPGRRQVHAARNHSTLLVFRKEKQ